MYSAQAYLSEVPIGGILILDLAADWTEHWRNPSFFGHPFIWCQFHENGGIMGAHSYNLYDLIALYRQPEIYLSGTCTCSMHHFKGPLLRIAHADMHGALQPLAAKMTKAMEDSLSPDMRMVGSGLCMEKFEDNPVVYEHFAEVMCAPLPCYQLVRCNSTLTSLRGFHH
eukprot:COSAG05_NODE_2522_length_2948_cov_1.656020_3_plen_169_part_00